MAKTSKFQDILSEIELFLNAGRYDDAKVLLNFADHDPADRITRLQLLLINATIDGAFRYKDEIDQLVNLSNPNDVEKEIARKLLLLASNTSERDDRTFRPLTCTRNQSLDDTTSGLPSANPLENDTEHQLSYESELAAIRQQLAEVAAATEQTVRSLQATVNQHAELLQSQEAGLDAQEMRYSQIIRTLDIQLNDKDELLQAHDAQLQTARAEVGRLTAQFAEFFDAKDWQINALCEELTRQTEMLQVNDSGLKEFETRHAEQLRALEHQLGEQQNLLHSRNAELDTCILQLRELTREHDKLKSTREMSENLVQEKLQEKTVQLETMATAIERLETQSSATISGLQRQLTKTHTIIEHREIELAELRNQIRFLTTRLAGTEDERSRSETTPRDEHHQAGYPTPVNHSRHDIGTRVQFRITQSIGIASEVLSDTISECLGHLRRAWLETWKPRIFSQTALPLASSVLLIIPIAYLLGGQVRTIANTGTNEGLRQSQEPEASRRELLASKELTPAPTVSTSSQKSLRRGWQTPPAVTYVTRRPVTLRDSPRYAAAANTRIVPGTQVSVLATQGDWFKVKTQPKGSVGYVRREYLMPDNDTQY